MKKISNIIYCLLLCILVIACSKESANTDTSNQAKSGSITKFAIAGNYLYTLGASTIEVFNITNKQHPVKVNSITTANNIETIFSYLGRLYLGATDGVYIVDISMPTQPIVLGRASHQVGCDPVVAKGNVAYSTVLQSRFCNNGTNITQSELMVIDAFSFQIITSIALQEPQGLGYDGNYLFVCNGIYGINIYDITNETNPNHINTIYNINAKDLITDNNTLIVASENGYSFYDYSNINSVVKLAEINKN